MFTGAYVRAIDEKLRVPIPKPLVQQLESRDRLFVTPGTDGSLALYTEEALLVLAQRLAAASPAAEDVRAFSRLFYAQAQCVRLDKQSRVRIPTELAGSAGLATEAVLVGVGNHLEIWDKARWEQYLAQKSPQYDQIAQSAFAVSQQSASSSKPET